MLDSLPRVWWAFDLPGFRESNRLATYSESGYDRLPPIVRALDDDLRWLRAQPPVGESLAESPRSPDPARPATAEALNDLLGGRQVTLPPSFVTFVSDPEPRRRVRSCTACHLDLADTAVDVPDEGLLIHFLSDQQWVLHWLLCVGRDGSEAVVVTESALGFDLDEPAAVSIDPGELDGGVCAASFAEFLYRFWIENEIWFRLAAADADGPRGDPLTDEQRRYAEHYLDRRPPVPERRPS